MSGREIHIAGKEGDFMGYLSAPGDGGPGVIVIQEIFGVNKWVRDMCDYMAGQGYMALAPDLFWRQEPGVQLDANTEEGFNAGLDLYGKFSVDKGIEDIAKSISELRGMDGCNGSVGAMGFCLGGFLTYLTSTRTDVDSASAYYGVGIESLLSEATNINKPLLIHLASEDSFVPKDAQSQIKDSLEGHELITIHEYAGMDHGFCRETDPTHYNMESADMAHGRTLDLFHRTLA